MKRNRNKFKINKWVVLFCILLFFIFFISEKGRERVNTWISLFEAPDNHEIITADYQVDPARELEKARVTKWIARKYKVSHKAVRKIVDISFEAGEKFEVDPYVIIAVMAIESSFNPFAESSAGALGLMQVMPKVHKEKFEKYGGLDNSIDVKVNIYVGTEILKNYLLRYGNFQRALRAYVGVSQTSKSRYPKKVLRVRERLKKLIKAG